MLLLPPHLLFNQLASIIAWHGHYCYSPSIRSSHLTFIPWPQSSNLTTAATPWLFKYNCWGIQQTLESCLENFSLHLLFHVECQKTQLVHQTRKFKSIPNRNRESSLWLEDFIIPQPRVTVQNPPSLFESRLHLRKTFYYQQIWPI